MKIGLVIPVYNRPEYLFQCIESLNKLTTKPDVLIFVDDASTDVKTREYLTNICADNSNTYVTTNGRNIGVRGSLRIGIKQLFDVDCDLVINLDSDAIVKPDFIEVLGRMYNPHGGIVSGFNSDSKTNQIIPGTYSGTSGGKRFGNGINMLFDRHMYEKYIKPSLLMEGNWDYNTSLACQRDNLAFRIAIPSVVQHIGIESSMGHKGKPDVACDFKMLSLPNVTLFGIDAHDPAGIVRAAEISQRDIEFGKVDIITERLFSGREAYSKWILKDLAARITTSHVLIIHPDGYVLNWKSWDNSWLQYDYIGATWWYKDNMNVGNGGFSLRSKKLMQIMAKHDLKEHHPEDHIICRLYRESLERDFGIKFAPEEVANRFSIEAYGVPASDSKYVDQFGFHSKHVDMRHLPEWLQYKPQAQSRQNINVQTFNRPNQSRHNPVR